MASQFLLEGTHKRFGFWCGCYLMNLVVPGILIMLANGAVQAGIAAGMLMVWAFGALVCMSLRFVGTAILWGGGIIALTQWCMGGIHSFAAGIALEYWKSESRLGKPLRTFDSFSAGLTVSISTGFILMAIGFVIGTVLLAICYRRLLYQILLRPLSARGLD
jgi:hypothetical protein